VTQAGSALTLVLWPPPAVSVRSAIRKRLAGRWPRPDRHEAALARRVPQRGARPLQGSTSTPELAADRRRTADNDADALRASPLLVDQYSVAAKNIALRIRERQGEFVPCDPAEGAACGRTFIEDLAPRAYRRPLTTPELDELTAIFDGYLAQDGFDVALG
jgi:hypothetical protein